MRILDFVARSMKACRASVPCAVMLALAMAALYVAVAPSLQHQHWDSLSYALDAEGTERWAIVGNHPLTHIVWNLILRAARLVGYGGRALPLLKVINCGLSGCAVGLLYLVLARELRVSAALAAGLASLFGGTAVMMRYTGSADIYSLSVLVSVVVWGLLIHGVNRTGQNAGCWLRRGAVAGLAVLTHQLHGLLVPIGGWFVWRRAEHRLRSAALWMLGGGLTCGCGYLLAAYAAIGAASPVRVLEWTRGYVGNPSYGQWLTLRHLGLSASTLAATIVAPGWGRCLPLIRAGLLGLLCLLTVAFVATGWRRRSAAAGVVGLAAVIQIVLTWALIQWYEPWAQKFWLLTFVPATVCLGALAGGAEERCGTRPRLGLLPGATVCLGAALVLAFNVWTRGLPQRTDQEAFTRALRTWVVHTKPGDVLVTAGDLTQHLRFWENRPFTQTTDDIARAPRAADRFGAIRSEIRAAHVRGGQVFVADRVQEYVWGLLIEHGGVTRDDIRTFFSQFPREYAFTYTNDIDGTATAVFRLIGP